MWKLWKNCDADQVCGFAEKNEKPNTWLTYDVQRHQRVDLVAAAVAAGAVGVPMSTLARV